MGAATSKSSTGEMETLFRPSTRYRDRGGHVPTNFTEVELLPGLTTENGLATGITWEDFNRFLWNKIVWITPSVYICSQSFYGEGESVLVLEGRFDNRLRVCVLRNTANTPATATCDRTLRLFATSGEHAVDIHGCGNAVPSPLSGAGLSLFFQESRSCLRQVTLDGMPLSVDQCLALATMSRLDMELTIQSCSLTDDAAGAFVECLHQSDRGPVKLFDCTIDRQILASALTGNSRVTKLRPRIWETTDADMAILFAVLANNRGLVDVNMHGNPICDDNWSVLCEALKARPTLTCLDLIFTRPRHSWLTDEQKTHRTRAVAEMVQDNTFLLTPIHISEDERDKQIYTEEICPYLDTRIYRPRVLAVKQTTERSFREKVLGRALYCVKSKPNLVWMFLSENVDAFDVRRKKKRRRRMIVKCQ
jgi:hypothetical protein